MKMLTVSLLVCAMMSPIGADDVHMVQRSVSCPPGWTSYNDRCFYYVPAVLPWAVAEEKCLSMDAHLASVHNAEEYYAIQKMIANLTHAFGRTWLGGSDCQNEGVWLWTDGSRFDYRHCGHFDNRWWNQDCLQMNYGANKCWDDVQCSRKLPSVCAKKPQ